MHDSSPNRPAPSPGKHARLQRSLIIVGLFLLAVLLFAWLALPQIVKWRATSLIADRLHRPAEIRTVRFNPFALRMQVEGLRVMEPDGSVEFVSFESLDLDLAAESLLRLAPVVQEVRLVKPSVHLVRSAPHRYNIDDLIASFSGGPPAQSPPRFALNNLRVEDGRIEFRDLPARSTHAVTALSLALPFMSSLPQQTGTYAEPLLRAQVDGTPIELKGRARPFAEPRDAVFELKLANLDLTRFVGYLPYEPRFTLAGARLNADLTASFRQAKGGEPALEIGGNAALESVRLAQKDGAPLLGWRKLAASFDRIDPFARKLMLSKLSLDGLDANVKRGPDGRLNLERLLPAATPGKAASEASGKESDKVSDKKSGNDTGGWHIGLADLAIRGGTLRVSEEQAGQPFEGGARELDLAARGIEFDTAAGTTRIAEIRSKRAVLEMTLGPRAADAGSDKASSGDSSSAAAKGKPLPVSVGRLAIEGWSFKLQDRRQAQPTELALTPLALSARDFSGDLSKPLPVALQAGVGDGKATLEGDLTLSPLKAELALDVERLDLPPLQALLPEQLNLRLTRGSLNAHGKLKVAAAADGKPGGGFSGSYSGDARLADLDAVDAANGEQFLRWKTMAASGIEARLAPLGVAVNNIALSDFTARVTINPSGRINLQDIFSKQRAGTVPASSQASPPPQTAQTAQPSPEAGKPVPISIRKLTFERGRVRFSDNFIKPNYSARLLNLGGTVEGLSPDPASTASVDLRGEVNGAPLSIVGRINPFRRDLLLNVKANVRGMDLASLSPYANRYVGYGIEKGKLSFEVAYRVEQRQLSAENRLILNQLTLSDEATNPQATRLPVKLALALLQDRNGVIDVNVPIQGSLNDPEFSLGGIVLKIIGNAVLKAVSQPFAALGALFSGGQHAEASSMPFEPGLATISASGEASLQSLARALANRPAVRLEINGWADPVADREGLKRASIDRKVRTMKRNDLLARGEDAAYGGIAVNELEYPALLARVYREEKFQKPRNVIGLEKRLPAAEMEQLIIAHTEIGEDDLRALADRRARAVRDWLIKMGHIPGDRLFLLAPDIGKADGKAGGASFSKVEFALK